MLLDDLPQCTAVGARQGAQQVDDPLSATPLYGKLRRARPGGAWQTHPGTRRWRGWRRRSATSPMATPLG